MKTGKKELLFLGKTYKSLSVQSRAAQAALNEIKENKKECFTIFKQKVKDSLLKSVSKELKATLTKESIYEHSNGKRTKMSGLDIAMLEVTKMLGGSWTGRPIKLQTENMLVVIEFKNVMEDLFGITTDGHDIEKGSTVISLVKK